MRPPTASAAGTSLLHGKAAFTTTQQTCSCEVQPLHPPKVGPMQQQDKHGAPGLQQNSISRQQHPTFPEQPHVINVLQLTQQSAQQIVCSASLIASFDIF